MRVKRGTMQTGIAGRLVALGTASVAGRLAALGPAGLAGRLPTLSLAGIACLASCLGALRLTGVASMASVLVTGIAGILTTLCPTCVTRCLITVRTASARASEPKAFGALLRLTATRLISDTAKWLGWAFDSYRDGAVEIRIRNIGLGSPRWSRAQLYVKIEFVLRRRPRGSCIFNDSVFFNADPRRLEPYHRRLIGGNRLGKYDIFPPELRVISERAVEVEPPPAVAVAFSGQPLQYDNVRWRRRRFRSQLLYMRVLLEKSLVTFVTSISSLGSHDAS